MKYAQMYTTYMFGCKLPDLSLPFYIVTEGYLLLRL
jgi:hypothetical protein